MSLSGSQDVNMQDAYETASSHSSDDESGRSGRIIEPSTPVKSASAKHVALDSGYVSMLGASKKPIRFSGTTHVPLRQRTPPSPTPLPDRKRQSATTSSEFSDSGIEPAASFASLKAAPYVKAASGPPLATLPPNRNQEATSAWATPSPEKLFSVPIEARAQFFDHWLHIKGLRGYQAIFELGKSGRGGILDFTVTMAPVWDKTLSQYGLYELPRLHGQIATEMQNVLTDATRWEFCYFTTSTADSATLEKPSNDVRTAKLSRAKLAWVKWAIDHLHWYDMPSDRFVPFGVGYTGKFLEPLEGVAKYNTTQSAAQAQHWPFITRVGQRRDEGEEARVRVAGEKGTDIEGTIRKEVNGDIENMFEWCVRYSVSFKERARKSVDWSAQKQDLRWIINLGYGEAWMWVDPAKAKKGNEM